MFVLKPRGDTAECAWHRVTIQVPDGDEVRERRIDVRYRILRQSEIDDALAGDVDVDDADGTVEFLARVIDDWRGMHIEIGPGEHEPLECTPETIAQACDVVYVRSALLDGFFRAVSGQGARRRAARHRKNS